MWKISRGGILPAFLSTADDAYRFGKKSFGSLDQIRRQRITTSTGRRRASSQRRNRNDTRIKAGCKFKCRQRRNSRCRDGRQQEWEATDQLPSFISHDHFGCAL